MSDAQRRGPFALAAFRRLFAAQTISRWGDTFNAVAIIILVFQITGSGLRVAGTVAFEILPVLLLAPLAGAVADRFPKRRVMVAADAAWFLHEGGSGNPRISSISEKVMSTVRFGLPASHPASARYFPVWRAVGAMGSIPSSAEPDSAKSSRILVLPWSAASRPTSSSDHTSSRPGCRSIICRANFLVLSTSGPCPSKTITPSAG